MNSTVTSTLRQSLTSAGFLIGTLGVVAITIFASIEGIVGAFRSPELLPNGWHGAQVLAAMQSDAFLMTLPIWASLPYTSSFIDDVKSGFVKLYLHRTNQRRYLASKIIGSVVSGGLVFVAGIVFTYGLFALVFLPMEAAADPALPAQTPYILQVLQQLVPVFFSGALWASVGMLLSTATGSKYIAYASPFIAYYLLVILHDRYLPNLYVLYPPEWLKPGDYWVLGSWGAVILLIELTCICSALFWFAGERRLSRL